MVRRRGGQLIHYTRRAKFAFVHTLHAEGSSKTEDRDIHALSRYIRRDILVYIRRAIYMHSYILYLLTEAEHREHLLQRASLAPGCARPISSRLAAIERHWRVRGGGRRRREHGACPE